MTILTTPKGNNMKELAEALARAQGEVENAKRQNINPHFRSKYADLATIWDVIREPLTKNGLSVVQLPCEAPEGKVGLLTILLHASGQSLAEKFFVGLKDPTNPQSVGSALTYMKRYVLLGVAGIAPEDDDGNAATQGQSRPSGTDYAQTIQDTLKSLQTASEQESRALYATVKNSSLPQQVKDELLAKMAEAIKAKAPKVAK